MLHFLLQNLFPRYRSNLQRNGNFSELKGNNIDLERIAGDSNMAGFTLLHIIVKFLNIIEKIDASIGQLSIG